MSCSGPQQSFQTFARPIYDPFVAGRNEPCSEPSEPVRFALSTHPTVREHLLFFPSVQINDICKCDDSRMLKVDKSRPHFQETNRDARGPDMDPRETQTRSTQQHVSSQTTRHISAVQEVQAILHAGRRSSAPMTEESSSLKETARESNNGPAMGPPELSAADLRKQKRFTLTLPITTNLNQFAPSGPTSPTRSIAPSITPSEDATRPTTPSEPNFLTALAAQERRVLELKEELAKAEQVLQKLKKEWAIHEVHKKRQDIRDSRRSRIPKHANQASSAASIKSEDSDTQSDMAAREAEKRRAMHYQAKTSQRKVFSGSKHARALSLLSPDPQDGAFPSTVTRDGEPSATASLVTQDGIEPHAPRVVPHQRVVSGEMQRSKSNYGPDGEIDIPREVLMRAGRQMASDFKDGLWTFLEDLRQVTVGDEAAAATSTRPRPQRPDVNVRMPQAKTGQTDKRTKAATSSPGRVQKSKRIPPPSRRGNGQAESADEGSPKDSAVGFDEQDSTGKSLVDVDVTASPTAKKTPRRRSLVKPDTRKSPNGPDDADAWDNWDSPQTAQKTQEPHRLQSRNDEAISFEQGHSDFKDLLDAADEKAGRREPIPWPALTKLPSNLKRTASHLMSEWEKSLAPLPETKHVPHPEDHYFDGMTTVSVKKMD